MGGVPKTLEPVKLFTGLILSQGIAFDAVKPALEAAFGPADRVSPEMDFSKYTPYYHDEMGEGLRRVFVSFDRLIDRTLLPDIKHRTGKIEAEFLLHGKRCVNLDPGYLTMGQLFLASTKNNFFRIYLCDGIFAEVTLYYERGGYVDFPWTYRDYQSAAYKNIFLQIRAIYKKQLAVLR